jgi:hypothetical protein
MALNRCKSNVLKPVGIERLRSVCETQSAYPI